ncbi:MAG: DUF6090 family protein [Flavobacteriaceae bacterium]|nr:DUF6090 family protein [Flavobacteriaceae bacterium]
MIRFFKKIRKQLVANNNIQIYLKYAIGEILLVMIGILLALQVNNWNENQKLKDQELKALKELQADLEQSLEDIVGDKRIFERSMSSNQIILDQMERSSPYQDSLNPHFAILFPFSTFSINSTTFDNITRSGVNLISNDSLRISISDFYTSYVNLYKELEQRVLIEHNNNYVKPMLMSAFSTYQFQSMVPRDYNSFINNPEYRQVLNFNVTVLGGIIEFQGSLIKTITRIIDQLKNEIEHMS